MFDIVQILLLATSYSWLAYLLVLTLLAMATRRRSFPRSGNYRFAVVIPAHNEEAGIGETIHSIRRIEYPKDLYETVVIADNCSDSTATRARGLGATVMERNNPHLRGKGYALRWGFDRLLESHPDLDAFVVIDADSLPSRNFLAVLSGYLQGGAEAVQSSDLVSPHVGSWSAQMTRIGFMLYNYVRPLGRRALGGTAGLRGNGMCFRASLLRAYPWNAYSINEDLEYGLYLMLQGVRVTFAPEATVYATMPGSAKNAESQRARWEGGRWGLIKRYACPLLVRAIGRRSLASLDALFDLVTPALVNFIAAMLIAGAATLCLGIVRDAVPSVFVALWFLGAGLGIIHLLAGLWIAGADASLFRALVHIPKYAFWKVKVYAAMPGRWSRNIWARTAREP